MKIHIKEIVLEIKMSHISCLVVGDCHFQVNNTLETDMMADKIIGIIKERNPTYVVVLGDVQHQHERLHVAPLERSIKFLFKICQLAPLYLIIGNHDRPNNSDFLSDLHPFGALRFWPNTTIVDKVMRRTTTSADGSHKKDIVLAPYVFPGRLREALLTADSRTVQLPLNPEHDKLEEDVRKELEAGMPAILDGSTTAYLHQEMRYGKMGAIISTIGDVWPLNYPLIISGHLHDYHTPQPNVIYVGTPFQQSFGESSNKAVSFFTWSDPNSNEYTHERIDLGIPKKILLHVPAPEIMTYKPPDPTNASIKIIVNGTSAEIKAAMKSAKVKEWMSSGIKVVFKDLPSKLPLNSNELPENAPVEKYSTRLYGAINTDERVKRTFERLFGKLSLNPDMITTAPVDKPVIKPKLRLKKTDNSS